MPGDFRQPIGEVPGTEEEGPVDGDRVDRLAVGVVEAGRLDALHATHHHLQRLRQPPRLVQRLGQVRPVDGLLIEASETGRDLEGLRQAVDGRVDIYFVDSLTVETAERPEAACSSPGR